ncbi:hypothetical protein LDK53_02760 [Enterobacter sp. K16B]|uniref:hypothetical protein n=1 Tax=Enterobacter sp. K16B TaxID=2878537 RepID=UPI001CDA22A5|nr:hypothetical protein [Enterobacter sp. K16B]MCA2024850.1 hypothetical protein [Enterobacter sp. K16B]
MADIADGRIVPDIGTDQEKISPQEEINSHERKLKTPKWQMYVWASCGIILSLELLGLTVLAYVRTKEIATIVSRTAINDGAFILAGLSMSAFSLIRILAILIGSAIIFGGLSISFFTSERVNNVQVTGNDKIPMSAQIASHSPGVMGILIGGIIIICALFAPTHFNYQQPVTFQYSGNNAPETVMRTPVAMSPETLRKQLKHEAQK